MRDSEIAGRVETSAWTRSVWVYGDGKETKALSGA
jgi:hypothetical protein